MTRPSTPDVERPWWRRWRSWNAPDVAYHWFGHYDGIEPRRDGRPRPPVDGLSLRFGPIDDGLDPPGPMLVASAINDGYELFLGYMSEWRFHCTRKEARRLAWWILLRWWAAGEWFGLRRALWYWALFKRVDRTRRHGPSEQPTTSQAPETE